jgi:hypothetical protein
MDFHIMVFILKNVQLMFEHRLLSFISAAARKDEKKEGMF